MNTNKFGIAINKPQAVEITKAGKVAVYRIPAKPVDYVTEYEVTRTIMVKKLLLLEDLVIVKLFKQKCLRKILIRNILEYL